MLKLILFQQNIIINFQCKYYNPNAEDISSVISDSDVKYFCNEKKNKNFSFYFVFNYELPCSIGHIHRVFEKKSIQPIFVDFCEIK